MPFITTSLLRRLFLLLTLALTGAGCQSSRLALQFRPTTPGSAAILHMAESGVAMGAQTSAKPASSPSVATQARLEKGATLFQPGARPVRRLAARSRLARQPGPLLSSQAANGLFTTPRPTRFARLAQLASSLHHPALAPAENGLGTTFLGILGIVALLVGLVGLIFAGWGFFGWLAAAGAVALLISIVVPYISGYN